MTRNELIKEITRLGYPASDFWVVAGSAMVLHGLRDECSDIDLGCTSALADRLEEDGAPTERLPDGTRRITLSKKTELFEGWLYDGVVTRHGIPVISLRGLLMMKKALGRQKDVDDILLLESALGGNKSEGEDNE